MTLSDQAIRNPDVDLLDRKRLANALARTLKSPDLGTPIAVAVYGDWGTGKTSVMRMVEAYLQPDSICLWFDAWRYARQEEALWRALLLAVVDELRRALKPKALQGSEKSDAKREQELDSLVERLYRSRTDVERGAARFDLKSAATLGLDIALRYASLGTVSVHEILGAVKGGDAEKAAKLIRHAESQHFRAQVTSLDQFYRELGTLLRSHGISGGENGRRLYVFVDDLDRCLPENAVGALEAVKLFLDFEGCVFVLGMDRRVIEQGIAVRYQAYNAALGEPIDPRQYLDKIIQLPVTLPPLDRAQIGHYLAELEGKSSDPLVKQCHHLVQLGTPTNPRSVKRVLNSLILMLELAGTRSLSGSQAEEEARYLTKLAVLQVCQPELFRRIADQPDYLTTLEAAARNHGVRSEARTLLDEAKYHSVDELLAMAPYFDALLEDNLVRLIGLSSRTA